MNETILLSRIEIAEDDQCVLGTHLVVETRHRGPFKESTVVRTDHDDGVLTGKAHLETRTILTISEDESEPITERLCGLVLAFDELEPGEPEEHGTFRLAPGLARFSEAAYYRLCGSDDARNVTSGRSIGLVSPEDA